MKLIFLDVDGVLNLKRFRDYLTERNFNIEEFFMNNIYDPESMFNLKSVVTETNAKIILTSTRRVDENCITTFKSNMLLYGLLSSYKGLINPKIEEKDDAIIQFIKDTEFWNRLNDDDNVIEKYIILDDFEAQFKDENLRKNLYEIDPEKGITKIDALKIVERLS